MRLSDAFHAEECKPCFCLACRDMYVLRCFPLIIDKKRLLSRLQHNLIEFCPVSKGIPLNNNSLPGRDDSLILEKIGFGVSTYDA